jgi:hypothetical protein
MDRIRRTIIREFRDFLTSFTDDQGSSTYGNRTKAIGEGSIVDLFPLTVADPPCSQRRIFGGVLCSSQRAKAHLGLVRQHSPSTHARDLRQSRTRSGLDALPELRADPFGDPCPHLRSAPHHLTAGSSPKPSQQPRSCLGRGHSANGSIPAAQVCAVRLQEVRCCSGAVLSRLDEGDPDQLLPAMREQGSFQCQFRTGRDIIFSVSSRVTEAFIDSLP